jgi:hypothetical protein
LLFHQKILPVFLHHCCNRHIGFPDHDFVISTVFNYQIAEREYNRIRARNVIPLFIIREAILLLPPVTLFRYIGKARGQKQALLSETRLKCTDCRSGSGSFWIMEPAQLNKWR